MLYDLNLPWTPTLSPSSLSTTLSFLSELGYQTIALSHVQSDRPLSAQLTNPIPQSFSFFLSPKLTVLHRCTLIFSDPAQNHRLTILCSLYDILALRPTNEKAFLAACLNVSEHSMISLDLSIRYSFHFKPKPLMTAVNRGIRIEICYGQCIGADSAGRRNFIANFMSIVRCTRGRGLVISSEARSVLQCRGVADVVNLLSVWGLSKERAVEGLDVNARAVVVNEGIKRRGFRGVINVIDGGQSLALHENSDNHKGHTQLGVQTKDECKRSVGEALGDGTPAISKKAAKRARLKEIHGAKAATLLARNETAQVMTTMVTTENPASVEQTHPNGTGRKRSSKNIFR